MPLGIATDRAFRSTAELRTLVGAVRDAPRSEMERHWIEWKAAEKLTAKSCLVDIAHHVIGFANRQVETAAEVAEGCAYLLVGVEPGCIASVDVIDIAKLEQGLLPYLGNDGPRWSTDYPEVDGNTVLVVSIEAPRWGDSIHTLRQSFLPEDKRAKSYVAGTVYIRKNGRTEHPPDQASWEILQQRLIRRNVQFDLDVLWSPVSAAAIVALDASPDTLHTWLEKERCRLLAPLEADEKWRATNQQAQFALGKLGIRLPDIPNMTAHLRIGDRRSLEEYRDEVNKYLAHAEAKVAVQARARAVEQVAPILEVMVTNGTERNFQDVKVEIAFMGQVTGYVDEREVWRDVDFPAAPKLYGTQTLFIPMDDYVGPRKPSPPYKGWANNTPGGCRIHFLPINLRPRDSVRLPSFRLLAHPGAAGTTLTGIWHATSTSADGVRQGQLSVSVDPTVVSADAVLSDGEDHID